jgi:hypothetical protein
LEPNAYGGGDEEEEEEEEEDDEERGTRMMTCKTESRLTNHDPTGRLKQSQ